MFDQEHGFRYGKVFYLSRLDIYKKVRPFVIRVEGHRIPGPHTNMVFEPFDVPLIDIRGHEQNYTLEADGFQVGNWSTDFSADNWDVDHIVKSYCAESVKHMWELFPNAFQIHVARYTVRYPIIVQLTPFS